MVDLLGSLDFSVRRRAALRVSYQKEAAPLDVRLNASIGALSDPDAHVRANIAAALGQMGAIAAPAVEGLKRLLRDPSWRVRRNATYALQRIAYARGPGG
jgi:HEAT repeat protein